MCKNETLKLNSICNVNKPPTFKSSKYNVDVPTCVCCSCKHLPPIMTNMFFSSTKKKLQVYYHMQDFGQLPKYAMGDDGHHGVYYDYKHVLQM